MGFFGRPLRPSPADHVLYLRSPGSRHSSPLLSSLSSLHAHTVHHKVYTIIFCALSCGCLFRAPGRIHAVRRGPRAIPSGAGRGPASRLSPFMETVVRRACAQKSALLGDEGSWASQNRLFSAARPHTRPVFIVPGREEPCGSSRQLGKCYSHGRQGGWPLRPGTEKC